MESIGKVKWFNNEKGYGFIESEQHTGDIMAHYSDIQTTGFRKLTQGQMVSFTIEEDSKGLKARGIVPV